MKLTSNNYYICYKKDSVDLLPAKRFGRQTNTNNPRIPDPKIGQVNYPVQVNCEML